MSRISRCPKPVIGTLDDSGTLVRTAAVGVLAGTDASTRLKLLQPADRTTFAATLDDYVAAQRFNADRLEGRTNLGTLHAKQGKINQAVAQYRGALALDPTYVQAAVNLADLYRARGLEGDAGEDERAAAYARRLNELEPDNPKVQRLFGQFEGAGR